MQKDAEYPAVNELIIKLASRCNIKCTYCFWFNDPLVMSSPKTIQPDSISALLIKLSKHIKEYQLIQFSIAFHGGEPTLFPKQRFAELCQSLRQIEIETGCQFSFSIQSNALLIDDEWITLLKRYAVTLGVSLDGDKHLHDKYRIDHKGRGTYQKTVEAITRIRKAGLKVYILSVASNETDPNQIIDHFVEQLDLRSFDLLWPHLHHEDPSESFADYFCALFDRYLDDLIDQDVDIRILNDLMSRSIGGKSSVEGYGYISTVTLLTDGQLEAIDDLRMISGLEPSQINIKTHELQAVTQDPLWQEVYYRSLNLASPCNRCEYKQVCGGGPMVSRWSEQNRFDNVSFYCQDYQDIIRHIQLRLQPVLGQLSA